MTVVGGDRQTVDPVKRASNGDPRSGREEAKRRELKETELELRPGKSGEAGLGISKGGILRRPGAWIRVRGGKWRAKGHRGWISPWRSPRHKAELRFSNECDGGPPPKEKKDKSEDSAS